MAMYIFFGLFLFACAGMVVLFVRHIREIRALTEEKIFQFIESNPSPLYQIKADYLLPFLQWCKQTASFLFYHFGEWIVRRIRASLLYIERRLRKVGEYLHGRKVVMRKKGQSPFWDSMHEWKEEIKSGNGKDKPL